MIKILNKMTRKDFQRINEGRIAKAQLDRPNYDPLVDLVETFRIKPYRPIKSNVKDVNVSPYVLPFGGVLAVLATFAIASSGCDKKPNNSYEKPDNKPKVEVVATKEQADNSLEQKAETPVEPITDLKSKYAKEGVIFTGKEAKQFESLGGSLDEAVEFDNLMFTPKQMLNYKKIGTLEEAKKLAILNLMDGVDFGAQDIIRYKQAGGTLELAKEAFSHKDFAGDLCFDVPELIRYARSKGTVEGLREFLSVKNVDGESVFTTGYGINKYKQLGGNLEEARELAELGFHGSGILDFKELRLKIEQVRGFKDVRDKDGKLIFEGRHICQYLENKGTAEEAKEFASIILERKKDAPDSLADIKDPKWRELFREHESNMHNLGQNLFTDGFFIERFKALGGTVEEAKEFAQIYNSKGLPFFNERLVLSYKEVGRTAEDAKKIAAMNISDNRKKAIFRYGLCKEDLEFKDTKKTNAVVIYPVGDLGNAFYGFREFKDKLSKGPYDVRAVVAETEQQVYDAIKSTPNIDLLVLSGHGNKTGLSLGEGTWLMGPKREPYRIDLTDTEFAPYLKMLNDGAVIFLNSCFNGKGGKGAKNLANQIMMWSDGKTVYAAKTEFTKLEAEIKSLLPFEVQITRHGKDVTYTNKE